MKFDTIVAGLFKENRDHTFFQQPDAPVDNQTIQTIYQILYGTYGPEKLQQLKLVATEHYGELQDQTRFQRWLVEYVLTSAEDLFEEYGVET